MCVSSFVFGFRSGISLMVEVLNKDEEFLSECGDPSSDDGM